MAEDGYDMKVGFDEQIFLTQRFGGISRYFSNLVAILCSTPRYGVQIVQGWRWSPNVHANLIGLSRAIPVLDRLGSSSPFLLGGYHVANTISRRSAALADVEHCTYYHPRFLKRRKGQLLVITIFDMIPELFPNQFPKGNPHLSKDRYVAAADMIVCVSHSARNDLVTIYGDPGVPMPVIYLGVDSAFSPGLAPISGVPARFLLYVGRRDGYKDFNVLARAFAAIQDKKVSLVAAGGGTFDELERSRLSSLGIQDRVLHLEVSDGDLARLYASAEALVMPSRHEGFGLPALEAMASGTPVVLANSSSLLEVGGSVARYFPVGDVGSLRTVLEELLEDRALREQIGAAGVARSARFTWEVMAEATAAAYRELARAA